jgi:ATP-dependent DNA helicase RecG
MNDELNEILARVALGEDSSQQFKVDIRNADSLAAEMAAFANANGGIIYIGIADDGSAIGLDQKNLGRVNQLVSNSASHCVRGPLVVETRNVALENGNVVIELKVPKGIDRPYFDTKGVIWFRVGSDKRRINSKEELRRLFQMSEQFHADELPTKADVDKLDKLRFRDFLKKEYDQDYPMDKVELSKLLNNMNLLADNGNLNLAGALMFAERPEWIVPQFVVKSIRFMGNEIHSTDYVDTEDFEGPLEKVFNDSLAFIMRNLHKVQAGQNVNSPGVPEVPKVVFEELLVNALIHRDYLVNAPIRLFIFDDRIEIISPGHLPNNLTVEKITKGNSNIRNPILASYVAKGLLPYHGLGSGIKRALANWSDINFINDHDGCLFIATINRPLYNSQESVSMVRESFGVNQYRHLDELLKPCAESLGQSDKIVNAIRMKHTITILELADIVGISGRSVQRVLRKLQVDNVIKRAGGRKFGYWEII